MNIASIDALLFFPAFSFQTLKSFQRTTKSLHEFTRSLLLVIERVFIVNCDAICNLEQCVGGCDNLIILTALGAPSKGASATLHVGTEYVSDRIGWLSINLNAL